jgi:septin family protein
LNNLTRYQDKIEWASKNINNVDCFLIKWKPKELEKIKGAEEIIKTIEETKTSEKEKDKDKAIKDLKEKLLKKNEELEKKEKENEELKNKLNEKN